MTLLREYSGDHQIEALTTPPHVSRNILASDLEQNLLMKPLVVTGTTPVSPHESIDRYGADRTRKRYIWGLSRCSPGPEIISSTETEVSLQSLVSVQIKPFQSVE